MTFLTALLLFMHDRKGRMADLADAFVVCPAGTARLRSSARC